MRRRADIRALLKVYRAVERYWHRMLRSRRSAGAHLTWDAFHQIKERMPLQQPKLQLPYRALQALAVQLLINRRRAWCGKSARHVLWEPEAGDRLR